MMIFRKKKKPRVSQEMLFRANQPDYVSRLPERDRAALIDVAKGYGPQCCAECIFYYNVFDESGFCGGKCTIADRVDIYDNLQKHSECPLE